MLLLPHLYIYIFLFPNLYVIKGKFWLEFTHLDTVLIFNFKCMRNVYLGLHYLKGNRSIFAPPHLEKKQKVFSTTESTLRHGVEWNRDSD